VLLHYLVKRGNAKVAFSLKCCISALPEFNQLLDFFNLFDSRPIFMLQCDSVSLVINALSHIDIGTVGGMVQKNISAKNYCNRIVYVKIIASRRWNVF